MSNQETYLCFYLTRYRLGCLDSSFDSIGYLGSSFRCPKSGRMMRLTADLKQVSLEFDVMGHLFPGCR